jgi:CPA2 family monovalent cation:H+ antiporter-2
MVLTRLLSDQGQLRTETGRVMVTITLVEDLAVVVLIVVIPSLGALEGSRGWVVAQELGRAIVILVPALFVAARFVPPLLKRVARTQSRELFFIVILAICLGIAALTQAIGLSLALGAFVAGLMISESDYAHEALAQLFSLRDAFVALFFVAIGLLINPRELFSNLAVVGTLIALIVFGKLLVWTGVVRLFGYPMWMALTVAAGLTQIGELSFVLVQVARKAGIVGGDVYNATLAASLVTILLNAVLFRTIPPWLARLRLARHAAHAQASPVRDGLCDHVVLCGFGRIGSAVGTALEAFRVPYVAIEIDPDIVTALRTRGVPAIYGDASHPHILRQAGIERAAMIITTLADPDRARRAIQNVRHANSYAPIVARAHHRSDHEILAQAGATEIIQPELEASATIIRHAFYYIKISDDQVRAYLRKFRAAMDSLQGKPAPSPLAFPEVREVTLTQSSLAGHSIRESLIRERFGVTIVSILRLSGEELLDPPADTILQAGDRLRILGLADEIDAFVLQADRSKQRATY